MAAEQVYAAARWTSAAAVVRALAQVLQLVLVARLFQGADLGVVILVFAVMAVAQLFADVGIGNLLLHHQTLSTTELRGIRGMGLAMGLLLFVALLIAAPWVAQLYGDPRLWGLVSLGSLLFLLNSLWQPKRALLEKSFDFRVIAQGEMAAALLSQATMVLLVRATGSVYAVLAAPLGNSLLMAVWLLLRRRHDEDFRFGFDPVVLRRFLGYAGNTLGFNLTNSVSVYADIFIGGRVLGTAALGGHGIAKDLSLKIGWIINPIVTRIATPLLAQLQNDRQRLCEVYLQVMRVTSALNFPVFAALIVFAPHYVPLVFGAPLAAYQHSFMLLGCWGLLRAIGAPSGSLFFALGKTRLAFRFSLGSMLLFAGSAGVGVQFGTTGLAWAMLGSMALQQLLAIWWFIVQPLTGMRYRQYARALLPAATAALVAFGAAHTVMRRVSDTAVLGWGGLIATALVTLVLYVTVLAVLDRPLAQQARRLLLGKA